MRQLGQQGVQRVDVICPGFASDCLETLEEIAIECKADFLNAGGKEYHYIACLNERDDWIRALSDIVLDHLQGWSSVVPDATALLDSRTRALSMGAPD